MSGHWLPPYWVGDMPDGVACCNCGDEGAVSVFAQRHSATGDVSTGAYCSNCEPARRYRPRLFLKTDKTGRVRVWRYDSGALIPLTGRDLKGIVDSGTDAFQWKVVTDD